MHGSAFEYHQDNALKAKPFFSPQGARKPKLVYNQFGATFGGPIKKDKLFYFASYEGTTDRQFASRFFTVPTVFMRRVTFRLVTRPIYDPETGNLTTRKSGPYSLRGSIIPDSRIDPIARKIFSLLPPPTNAGVTPTISTVKAVSLLPVIPSTQRLTGMRLRNSRCTAGSVF